MPTHLERREPVATTTDRSRSNLGGTWTIDPATSVVSFAWRAFRRWTITARRHCLGVIHLDELPPVGVIRFQQPSGLPFLTMALDPASLETGDADRRQRWWTLHSHSLEVLPSGAWRVMATLTTHRAQGLVELRLEVDPERSRRDLLVLRGRGVLDRRAFATSKRAWRFDPMTRLELAVHARRVETRPRTGRHEGDSGKRPSVTAGEPACRGQGPGDGRPPSVPSLALAGRVSGMSARRQDRVSVQVDAPHGG